MNPLPHLTIYDTSIRLDRQQCVLRASRVGIEFSRGSGHKLPNPALCNEESAIDDAKQILAANGVSDPTEKEYLGQLVLSFGKYSGCTFKWMLENDVGYIRYLVDKHLKETKCLARKAEIRDGWLKDYLAKYVQFFPQVSSLLEGNIHTCTYGHGMFKNHTYSEMWEMYNQFKGFISTPQTVKELDDVEYSHKAYNEVRMWLCKAPSDISTSSMKRFRLYVNERDKVSEVQSFSPSKHDSSWLDDSVLLEAISQEMPVEVDTPLDTKRLDATVCESLTTGHVSSPVAVQSPTSTSVTSSAISALRQTPDESSSSSKISDTTCSTSAIASVDKCLTKSDASTMQQMARMHSSPLASVSTVNPKRFSSAADTHIEFEGWCKSWEDPDSGIPKADLAWIKEDAEHGMFSNAQTYTDKYDVPRKRRILKNDRMWFYPPRSSWGDWW